MLLDKIKKTIGKYRLLDEKDSVLIGVSGGPDSVVLTHMLHGLRKELKLTLHIAHLDHGLRKDSGKDCEFVKSLGEKLDIPVSAHRIALNVGAHKGSIEEIARNCRLDFFCLVAKRIGADKIALGHTADDQAETVLMRILRGSGLYGLAAILPKRRILGHDIIRPLIEARRKEIEQFLKKRRLPWCTDSTNTEEKYFRNKIRLSLLPLLEREYNPRIKDILAHMAESIGYDYDYLYQKASRVVMKINKKMELKNFLRLHPSLQRMVLRLLIAKHKGNTRRISFVHMHELQDLIMHRPLNSIVDLPGELSVKKMGKYLHFYLRKKQ